MSRKLESSVTSETLYCEAMIIELKNQKGKRYLDWASPTVVSAPINIHNSDSENIVDMLSSFFSADFSFISNKKHIIKDNILL
ncbi:hypothetical protein GCM10027195_40210 [Comamonas sediminis]